MNGRSNVIPTRRNGNCLLCTVLYCMYNTEDRHSEIRLSTVNNIINEMGFYPDFIVNLSMVNRAEN